MSELPTETVTGNARHPRETKTNSRHNRRRNGSQLVTLWLLPAILSAAAVATANDTTSSAVSQNDQWAVQIRPLSKAPRRVEAEAQPATAQKEMETQNAVALAELQPEPNAAPSEDIAVGEPHPGGLKIMPKPVSARKSYASLYDSIRFSRTEYQADPSYRHDATMELLTGNPRPAKVYNYYTAPHAPELWWEPSYGHFHPYIYDLSRGPYSRYRSLFGYQGGYRPIYYQYGWPYRD